MPTLIRTSALGFAALLAGLCAPHAVASEDRDGNPIIQPVAPAARVTLLGLKPVDAKTLAAKRGGSDVVSDMRLKGVVADVRTKDVTTGNNVIADGAFAGAAGLPMVIQNSGNGVLIQNSTIVNLQVK